VLHWGSSAVGADHSWRLLAVDQLHVTLCFLGSHEESAVADVVTACRAALAGTAAARLRLGEGVWLPRRGPRVLAVGVDDLDGALAAVQDGLSRVLSAGGWYRPEHRPFLAHVTVARVRRGARVRPAADAPPEPIEFDGSSVVLFRSNLGPAGARYEPLAAVALEVSRGGRR
jgi:2'-5' RNA ligase